MAKQLVAQPLPNFGVNGLNTQSNPNSLDPSYLTAAENIVLRESGRISFRKGFKQKVVPSGTTINSIIEHNDQGTNKIFASHGTSIYTIDFTTPNAAFPASGADVKHTVGSTTGDWQFINFNERLTCIHTGVVPQRYNGAAGSGSKWAAFDNATRPPTVTTAEFKPSCGSGAYGRMWVGGVEEEKDVLHYSALLDADDFTTASGGGSIDLKKVWDKDDIIAIAPFYGQLAVFGKNNIAIYESPDVIGSIKLNEVIRGIGCIARDSVQAIGDDLVFLSSTGLRSLARTSEKDKVPLTDISSNIKDTLIRNISANDTTKIKSVYVENEGVYILSFTDVGINYVFDFKHFTPNQVPRITNWTFTNDREPTSMTYTELYGLLVGQKDGGIAGYEGYFDTDLAWVSSAASYTNSSINANVSSIWISLSQGSVASLLKKMILVLEGGSGATLGLRWYKDFSPTSSVTTSIPLRPATTGTTALYGNAASLYGASKFTPIYGLREYNTHLSGSAKTLKLNMSLVSNGYNASIQDLSILHLQGKIR
jgi:hypothetical protein